MSDEQRGPAGHDLLEPGVDPGFDPRVDRRGRVVEDQDAGIGQQRPGQRHPLALAAGQGQALLPDDRVVALRQPGDEFVRLGGHRRGQDLLPAGVGTPVRDVGPDRIGEQERVLADQPDRGPQRVQGEVTDVVAADPQRSAGHVVEAGEQLRDGRFSRPGGADQRDGLAHRHVQRQPAQHRPARHIAEAHVVEVHGGRGRSERHRAGPVGDTGLGVDDLEHPDHAGPRFLAGGHQRGQGADRADQLKQVGGERHERAQGDGALDGQPAAQREHPDLAERGHGLQGRVVPGHQAHRAHPGGVEQPARPFQPPDLLVFLAEALDHPDAGHGSVHHPGHGGRLLLGVPAGREQGAARGDRDEPQGGAYGQGDQGQQRGEEQHDGQRGDEQDRVAEQHRDHAEQGLDHGQVRDGAADDLAGVQLILARPVQPGQGAEHLGPQVVLDIQGDLAAAVAAQVEAREAGQRRAQQQDRERPDRRVPRADQVVHDLPLDQRDNRRDHGHDQRATQREHHVARIAPAVPREPP